MDKNYFSTIDENNNLVEFRIDETPKSINGVIHYTTVVIQSIDKIYLLPFTAAYDESKSIESAKKFIYEMKSICKSNGNIIFTKQLQSICTVWESEILTR